MADNNCTYKNPLIRDGVSQKQRMPEALDPNYVKVDERSLADLLRFVNHYAELLQYYGPNNRPKGNWQPFFERDMTSIIVLLTEEDAGKYIDCLDAMEATIEVESTTYQDIRKAFKTLFDLTATLAIEIDRWYRESAEGYRFQEHLNRLITADLRPALHKIIAFYKGALVGTDLVDKSYEVSKEALDLISFPNLKKQGMHPIWIDPSLEDAEEMSWEDFYENAISSDTSIYEGDTGTVQARVKEGLPEIKDIMLSFISALQTTKEQVPEFVEDALERFSAHEPHMGLLVTFFRLFRHAQDQMNTLTKRHLDFYYERVLQLARNKEVPDQVHLIVELAKHVDDHKIDEGTLFKAGKDQQGKEVLYRATEDIVLNKAVVQQLKSVYIDGADDSRIYDKPVANSKDGIGTELENPAEGWKAFGEPQYKEDSEGRKVYLDQDRATMKFSSVGFALSSPVLYLAEGTRIITIDIACEGGTSLESEVSDLEEDTPYSDLLDIYATGPEGWINLQEFNVIPTIERDGSTYSIAFTVVPEVPSIVAYDGTIHGLGYENSTPVLKVMLSNRREPHAYAYGFLKEKKIETIDLSVSVNGVKNLVLQNELGTLDPAKPFQPFGPSPSKGAAFHIGSREVFAKDLNSLSVRVQWHDYPKENLQLYYNYDQQGDMVGAKDFGSPISNDDFTIDAEILNNGNWYPVKTNTPLFPEAPSDLGDEGYLINQNGSGVSNISIGWEINTSNFSTYDVSLNRGFIRVLLSGPESAFGHNFYPRLLMKQLQDKDEVPVEPYTPKIKSIELDYSANVTLNSSDDNSHTSADQLYHVYPFGTERVYEGTDIQEDIFLLPRFVHAGESGGDISHVGEFYIGLSNLEPPQQISLLVKVAEGSGDPSLQPPDIHWFYLAEEGWTPFESADIVKDETNGLLDSGIIRFNIPHEATSNTTILTDNQYWIKAAINKNAAALCRLIDIKAQALAASFIDHENDPGFLSEVLAANTIAKLKNKQAAVKKVEQPYASEGGKVAERDEEYYRRVNERLRHKDRGISVWDYERLILQQFPSIYKAKCINHSTYGLTCGGHNTMNAEFAPGYVTVVVVPDLSNKSVFNMLEPRVSLNLLEEIKCYLKKKISIFAAQKLKVMNPLFEQVKVNFYVEFMAGKDEGFHRNKLLQEITAFLSPWAFKEGKEITFGGSIHKSVILNFVEEQPYVDFVTDFRMDHYVKGALKEKDVNEITTSEARSVLASYQEHSINDKSTCAS